ncbi:MAG TPA: tetratricopeptide repeat protein, partial [Methylotenera sp.]|nr:tetratricopeptide repeat protein [Methylotenera sp.]HPH04227.1 tetratricopeptide repeat protein [Methylotenera sp.]HPM99781.1 tetratricopeptide repeat protein [Methylotenera sp.]
VSAPDKRLAYVLALLIPLAALGVYHKIGMPAVILNPEIISAGETPAMAQAQIDALLGKIKAKLAQNPNDVEGWLLLARSNASLGNFEEALPAFEKASVLAPNDADLFADYADVLAIANGYKLAGKPEALLERALEINPKHEKSLKLAGAAAYERQDYAKVALFWGRLKEILPKDSPILPELSAALEKAQAMANEKPTGP